MTNSLRCLALFAVVALASPSSARAGILASYTGGTNDANTSGYFFGTSIHTGSQGPAHDLQFTFLGTNGTTPVASGTIYLLSSPYAGTPTALSSSTAGYLDSAVASGGIYTFNAATTVQADTDYYIYLATSVLHMGYGLHSGTAYQAVSPTSNYTTFNGIQLNHQLTGTVDTSTVPEPSTMALALSGLAAAGIAVLRRRTVA